MWGKGKVGVKWLSGFWEGFLMIFIVRLELIEKWLKGRFVESWDV